MEELSIGLKEEGRSMLDIAYQRLEDCRHVLDACRIKIVDSKHSNGFKELVAITIEDYLDAHIGNIWRISSLHKDEVSEDLAAYLNNIFPQEGPWIVNNTQHAFDIYSLNAKVAIELKIEKERSKRKRLTTKSKQTVGNATIYPDEAKVKDVMTKKDQIAQNLLESDLNEMLDVLVVFMSTVNSRLSRFIIIDGAYWGVKQIDHESCREFFNIINRPEVKTKILDIVLDYAPEQLFAQRMRTDKYNGTIELGLRKLITYKNPLWSNE